MSKPLLKSSVEIKEVQNVQQDVVRSSDKSVDDELLNGWTRPDSGK